MKIGAFSTFTPEYTFSEACRLLKGIGFEGVQPRIVPDASAVFDPAKPFNPWSNNKGGLKESDFFADPEGTLRPAKEAGLEITSVASYTGAADLERAVKMVQACGRAGIRHVRVSALPLPKDEVVDIPKLLDKSRGRYKELVGEARKAGVRPCLELHGGTPYPGPSGAIAFLKGFSPEEVGILYDPANMLSDGWETVRLSLNVLGDFLAEIHVKNAKWVETEAAPDGAKRWHVVNAELSEGCVDWAAIIEQLKARGYDGWLVEEGHTETRSYERLQEAHALLTKWIGR